MTTDFLATTEMVGTENVKSQLTSTTRKAKITIPPRPDDIFLYLHNFSIPHGPVSGVIGPCLGR